MGYATLEDVGEIPSSISIADATALTVRTFGYIESEAGAQLGKLTDSWTPYADKHLAAKKLWALKDQISKISTDFAKFLTDKTGKYPYQLLQGKPDEVAAQQLRVAMSGKVNSIDKAISDAGYYKASLWDQPWLSYRFYLDWADAADSVASGSKNTAEAFEKLSQKLNEYAKGASPTEAAGIMGVVGLIGLGIIVWAVSR